MYDSYFKIILFHLIMSLDFSPSAHPLSERSSFTAICSLVRTTYSDWLLLTNKRFEQQLGVASVLR